MNREIVPPTKFKMPGWPENQSVENLKLALGIMRQRDFDCGYRQRPATGDALIFPDFIREVSYTFGLNWRDISDKDSKNYDPQSEWYVDPTWTRYTGCDIAGKKRRGSVIFTLAMSPRGVRHVLDIKLGAWTGPVMTRAMQAVDDDPLLSPRVFFVENNAYQESLMDWVKEMDIPCWPKVKGFRTGSNKMDPETGLPAINVQYAQRRWRLAVRHKEFLPAEPDPKNATVCICGACMFIAATSVMTPDDLDETPDTIMAQFFAKEASRQGERYSESSINPVRVTQKNIQDAIHVAGSKRQSAFAFRLPVAYESKIYWGGQKPVTNKGGADFGRPEYALPIIEETT